MTKKFKHLDLSPHWQQYFSKYPQGYTIIENLIDWVSQVADMVDNQNELNTSVNTFGDRLDEFIGQYDTHLQETLEQTLSDWQNSGFLNIVINGILDTKYHEMDNRLSTQLAQTRNEKVDKNGSQQVKWANIAQDAREQISGDKVAVVGKDSVGTENLTEKAVTPVKTTFIRTSSNLLDIENALLDSGLDSEGNVTHNPSGTRQVLPSIDIHGNETCTYFGVSRIVFLDGEGTMIPGGSAYDVPVERTITAPTGTSKAMVEIFTSQVEVAQLNRGEVLLPYETYYPPTLSGEIRLGVSGENNEITNTLKRYSSYYESPELPRDLPTNYTEVYNWYDTLMGNSEGFVTRTVLGEDGQGNELRSYRFGKDEVENDFSLSKGKIGIMTGLHGNEKGQIVGLFNFLEALTYNESKNEIMDRIKSNMEFHVIPVGNPTGVNNNTRRNWNDVNLNRNFDYVHEESTAEDKGDYPASELETQIIQDWMQEHAFDLFIDFHRADMGSTDDASWLVARGDNADKVREDYYKVLTLLSTLWSERYEEIPKNINFGRINEYPDMPQSYQYASTLGMDAVVLEASQTWRYWPTDEGKLQHRNTWSADLIGNFIFEVGRRYI